MKLSQAIKEGAKLRPQGFGDLFTTSDSGDDVLSCALGGALEATGMLTPDTFFSNIDAKFCYLDLVAQFEGLDYFVNKQWYQRPKYSCPDCNTANEIDDIVIHLNDDEKWTREQIAAFVEAFGY